MGPGRRAADARDDGGRGDPATAEPARQIAAAEASLVRGSLDLHRGRLERAEQTFTGCLVVGERLGVPKLVNEGYLGRIRVAERRGDRAEVQRLSDLLEAVEGRSPEMAVQSRRTRAIATYEAGRLPEAEAALTGLLDELGEPTSESARNQLCLVLIDRATVRNAMNHHVQARADCDLVRSHARHLGAVQRGIHLVAVRAVERRAGRAGESPGLRDRATMAVDTAVGGLLTPGWARLERRSDLARENRNWRTSLRLSLKAARAADAGGWGEAAMMMRMRAASCELELQRPDRAAELAGAARDAFARMGAEDRLGAATMVLARARSAQGQHADACDLARESVAIAERRIRRFTVLAEQQRFVADKLRDYDDAFAIALAAGDVVLAWATAERAKSFYLCQAVVGSHDPPPRSTAHILNDLEEELDVLERGVSAQGRDEQTAARIADLRTRRSTLLDEVVRQDPALGAARVPGVLDLAEELERLVERWAPVSYFWSDRTMHAFATTSDGAPMHVTVEWDEDELAALGKATDRLSGVVPPFASVLPRSLGPKFLPPRILSQVAGRALLLSPHGPVTGVPLHAVDPDGEGALATRFRVQQIPTLALLPARRERPSGSGVLLLGAPETPHHPRAIGDVVEELDSLEGTWTRARPGAVVRRVLGRDDTPRSQGVPLESWETFGVVHLACHGRIDEDDPLDASLLLGANRLRASEFLVTRLLAEVLVLSACAVGRRGRRYAGSEVVADEWIGMVLPLLRAGVQTVVASLWDANTEVAVKFMVALHRALAEGGRPEDAYARAITAVAEEPEPFWLNWYLVGFPSRGEQ